MYELLGRFHVVVVHFPIALLIIGGALELVGLRYPDAARASAARMCIALGALSAVVAAALGWIHADCIDTGSSAAKTLALHRWFGVATALFACASVVFGAAAGASSTARKMRIASVLLAAALVGLTGHFGGTLVYGPGFFTSAFDDDKPPAPASGPVVQAAASNAPAANASGSVDFAAQIHPILEAHCYECHGARKHKGGLRLDNFEGAFDEREDGIAIKRGDPAQSEVYKRVTLPADDEDHMPPKKSGSPLSAEQTELLRHWIEQGAPISAASEPQRDDASEHAQLAEAPPPAEIAAAPARDPFETALSELRALGGIAQPVARDSDDLEVDLHLLGDAVGDAQVASLPALAPKLIQLDLARTAITDAAFEQIATLARLERLDVSNTATTDAALEHLAGLAKLEVLNLYGTRVSDRGLARLADLAALKRIYVWRTQVTEQGVAAFAASRSDVTVVRDG